MFGGLTRKHNELERSSSLWVLLLEDGRKGCRADKSIMCKGMKTANCRSHSEYGGKLSYVSDKAGTGVREVRHLLYSAQFKDILTLRCQP